MDDVWLEEKIESAKAGEMVGQAVLEATKKIAEGAMMSIKKVEPQTFIFEEEQGSEKEVWVLAGDKGDGKTTIALGFPGKIAALSFDHKTILVKKNIYKNDDRIKVYDALKYFDEEPSKKLESAITTFGYLLFLLKEIKEKIQPDYIVIDGSEIFTSIAELCMRKRNNVGLYSGIANQNLWKERKDFLIKLHRVAVASAKRGLIYTTYTEKEELVADGTLISREKVPKWTGIILYEADIVAYAYSKFDKDKGKRFYLKVANSKLEDVIKTGFHQDITGKKVSEFIKL